MRGLADPLQRFNVSTLQRRRCRCTSTRFYLISSTGFKENFLRILRWDAGLVERVVSNGLAKDAALPPDIRAFGEDFSHRLEDKTIHLGMDQ